MAGSPHFTALPQPPRLPAAFARKKHKEHGRISSKPRACGCRGDFWAGSDRHCLFCSLSPHDVFLQLSRAEPVLGGSLGCAERGLNPSTASPPWSPPVSSTSHLHSSEVQEPKSLKSQYGFKISGSTVPHLIWQLLPREWLPSRRLGYVSEV